MQGKKAPAPEIVFEMLSERYGWTPAQIREQNYQDIVDYIEIISIKNAIEKANNMRKK